MVLNTSHALLSSVGAKGRRNNHMTKEIKCTGLHCRCMNLDGNCPNMHHADCVEHNPYLKTYVSEQQPMDWEKQVNEFIKKWCGDNAAHLLDTDENDGQRLRNLLSTQQKDFDERVEGFIEELKSKQASESDLDEMFTNEFAIVENVNIGIGIGVALAKQRLQDKPEK